jgi:hypothetical protein
MDQSISCEADSSSAGQETLRVLWNLECSLPRSQEPVTGPYPEQAESSLRSQTLCISDPF